MRIASKTFVILASASYACFTRPDIRAERLSYEVPTVPALKGMLESVLWRRGVQWFIERYGILNPIRTINFTRNEIDRVPRNGVDLNRHGTQRRTQLLVNPAYLIFAHFEGKDGRLIRKVEAMGGRYLKNGKRFQTPYLGMRDFTAKVTLATNPLPIPVSETRPLGPMPHHYTWINGEVSQVHMFNAELVDGWVQVP